MAQAQLFLNGARVDEGFRNALLDAANRAGVSPLEFCLLATAEKLIRRNIPFPGVFRSGDIDFFRDRVGV